MKRYLALQKIVERGSFTKAAEDLGYTQSALSQMVASLEEELSIQLLIRSRTGVRLTVEGERLYPQVLGLANQYRRVMEKAAEIRGLETGVIRMGTISSISAHWLPKQMRDFQLLYPGVEFVLRQGDYTSFQEWLKTGEIDFAFVNPRGISGLVFTPLKKGPMLAVLPEGHPLAKEKAVPLKALAREPFILLEEGRYSEPLEAFRQVGEMPDIRFTLHDDYSIMLMVEAGLGVSILAELVLRRTHYRLALRPTVPAVERELAIGYRDKNSLPIASRRFIDYLAAHVEELA